MPAFPDDRSAEITAALGVLPTGTPVSEVARRMLDLFTGGSIAAGTRLPPERQLAATLGVGRSAVREALAALEILGIVDVRPGSGTYLRGAASELLPQTLRWGLLIGERNTAELLVFLAASIVGLPVPLLPLQVLWINLATDGLPALTLVTDPVEAQVLNRPPRDPKEPILGRGQWLIIAATALVESACVLFVFATELERRPVPEARALATAAAQTRWPRPLTPPGASPLLTSSTSIREMGERRCKLNACRGCAIGMPARNCGAGAVAMSRA